MARKKHQPFELQSRQIGNASCDSQHFIFIDHAAPVKTDVKLDEDPHVRASFRSFVGDRAGDIH